MLCDGSNSQEVDMSELTPVRAFKADQEVLVYDNEDDCQRATVIKIDGDDLVVRMDGNTKYVRNAVLLDSAIYKI